MQSYKNENLQIYHQKHHQQEQLQQHNNNELKSSMVKQINNKTLEDLIHLSGPLTEDAVLKCLQARFASTQYHVSSSSCTI